MKISRHTHLCNYRGFTGNSPWKHQKRETNVGNEVIKVQSVSSTRTDTQAHRPLTRVTSPRLPWSLYQQHRKHFLLFSCWCHSGWAFSLQIPLLPWQHTCSVTDCTILVHLNRVQFPESCFRIQLDPVICNFLFLTAVGKVGSCVRTQHKGLWGKSTAGSLEMRDMLRLSKT